MDRTLRFALAAVAITLLCIQPSTAGVLERTRRILGLEPKLFENVNSWLGKNTDEQLNPTERMNSMRSYFAGSKANMKPELAAAWQQVVDLAQIEENDEKRCGSEVSAKLRFIADKIKFKVNEVPAKPLEWMILYYSLLQSRLCGEEFEHEFRQIVESESLQGDLEFFTNLMGAIQLRLYKSKRTDLGYKRVDTMLRALGYGALAKAIVDTKRDLPVLKSSKAKTSAEISDWMMIEDARQVAQVVRELQVKCNNIMKSAGDVIKRAEFSALASDKGFASYLRSKGLHVAWQSMALCRNLVETNRKYNRDDEMLGKALADEILLRQRQQNGLDK